MSLLTELVVVQVVSEIPSRAFVTATVWCVPFFHHPLGFQISIKITDYTLSGVVHPLGRADPLKM